MKKVVIATKQTDIDLFNKRIDDIKKALQEFLNYYNMLGVSELKSEDLKRATQTTKDFVIEVLEGRLTETPQLAGLKLSKKAVLEMVDIDFTDVVRTGAYATSLAFKYRLDISKYFNVVNSIITVNENAVAVELDKFVTYAETTAEKTLYSKIKTITKQLNEFNDWVKKSNKSDIDLSGVTGAKQLQDYFKYNTIDKCYEMPLNGFQMIRQYIE